MATPRVGILITLDGVRAALSGLANIGQGIDKVSNSALRAGRNITSFGEGVERVGVGLTVRLTLPIIAAGTALFRMGSNAEETRNLFNVAMGDMADEANTFVQQTRKNLGLVEEDLQKMLGTTQQIVTSMGIADDAALEFSKTVTLLSNDLASFFNIGSEEAFQKIISGLTGEAEPLKRLGIIVTDVRLEQEALAVGIDTATSAMTEQQKVLLRLRAILNQTKNAQGDLARTIDSPANQMRILTGQIREQGIALGTALLPVFNNLISIVRVFLDTAVIPAINWFNSLDQATQNFIAVAVLATAAIGPLTAIVGTLITIVGRAVSVIGGLGKVIAFVARNPIILIGVGLVALIANLDKVIEVVRNVGRVFQNIWGLIKTTVLGVIENLRAAFLRFVVFIVDRLNTLTGFFDKAEARLRQLEERSTRRINALAAQQGGLLQNLGTQFGSLFTTIENGFDSLVMTASTSVDNIGTGFTSLTDNVRNASDAVFEEQQAQLQNTLELLDTMLADLEDKRARTEAATKAVSEEAKDRTLINFEGIKIKASQTLRTMEDAFSTLFTRIVTGGRSLKDVLGQVFRDIANTILQELARVVASKIFQLIFGAATGGAGFGAFGLASGPAQAGQITTAVGGGIFPFQTGGTVTVTKPTAFLAGEVGPERVSVRRLNDMNKSGDGAVNVFIPEGAVVDEIGFDRFVDRLVDAVRNRARDEL